MVVGGSFGVGVGLPPALELALPLALDSPVDALVVVVDSAVVVVVVVVESDEAPVGMAMAL